MKIAVIEAKGRMGQAISTAIDTAEDMELVAGLDAGDDPEAVLGATGAIHVVDFTSPGVTLNNAVTSLRAGVYVVVGTSGWTEEGCCQVHEATVATGKNAVVALNFTIPAVLAMKFAALATPYFESVEVVEMYHPDRIDAPSGTATATAKGIAAARATAGIPMTPDNTQFGELGTRGGKIMGVPIHAMRLRELYAHQETLLSNLGEQLVMCTDCSDRAVFMPGVLLALRQADTRPGLAIGLESLLGLEPNQQDGIVTKNFFELPEPRPARPGVLRLIPLGGLGEVGHDMMILETEDKILIIDCGVSFPKEIQPGVDLILPDFSYIKSRINQMVGIVLTHGHEDRTGAVPYLLKHRSSIPVYGSGLASALVEPRLQEHRLPMTNLQMKTEE